MTSITQVAATWLAATSLFFASIPASLAETVTIPADTRVFVTTLEELIGKKGQITEGQSVRAKVWKDVFIGKRVVIAKDTPVMVKVDYFKRNKIAGRKGKISLGAYEVMSVEGTPIALSGGYFKEGKGRIALVATLSAVVFIPLIFIKGKKASLPEGTVFDAFTTATTKIDFETSLPPMAFSLSNDTQSLEAELLYDELTGVEKPKFFPVQIKAPQYEDPEFLVDRINGEDGQKAIKVENVTTASCEETCTYRGEIPIKKLVKRFKKGLNTIEVSHTDDAGRLAAEILVEIEI